MNTRGVERLDAHAKITLALTITGRRPDGYHLLDAEMVSISLADTIEIRGSDTGSGLRRIDVSGPYAAGVPTDSSNLVARALDLAGVDARVTIDKRIPHGGGLGGGSTDAAAVLRWAGFDDLAAASAVGADIPFCMIGGRARVRGIGEIIDPLPFAPMTLTLVIPPIHVSTPAVYRAYADGHRHDAQASEEAKPGHGPGRNDLEVAALWVEPALVAWRQRIIDACGHTPTLAGSGATWFVVGKHDDALAALRNEGAEVLCAETVPAY